MENSSDMPGDALCHPMKRHRRQTLDEIDDQMATQGRPAAAVVDMRARRAAPET